MDYITELTAIASEHGGIIEAKVAAQRGISKAMLYKLCKEDKIHRIVKGQYILPDDMQDELLSISKRSDKIIFSHETALSCTGFPTEHPLNIPSRLHPVAFRLPQLNPSARCITSSRNCLSLGKQC